MRINVLIGGKAGQGINKVSEILSRTLASYGYYIFNYRDYQSMIRGGHNFNIVSISEIPIESHESKIDILVSFDDNTFNLHSKDLKKDSKVISYHKYENEGRNLNVALGGAVVKLFGIPFEELEKELKKEFSDFGQIVSSARKGYDSVEEKIKLKKLNNKVSMLSGSKAIAIGAINSNLDLYIAYPMTPATNAMHELAETQLQNKLMVFQAENEIAVANMALGASFAGAKTMIGSSGGGFDLMTEALSMQGITGIPLTVYLASRPGPGTGVPTYSSQSDLDVALRAGHGEFPRLVVAPSNPIETIEKTNEAIFLSEKFKTLSIVLSDKHLAESEFSSSEITKNPLKVKLDRKLPGQKIIKVSTYETDKFGNSTEDSLQVISNTEARIEKYKELKKYIEKNFETIKLHGNKKSKNLIISWGSSSCAVKDAISDLDCKFLQVMYLKPLSSFIKKEMETAKNIILVEQNVTGQLGRLLKEKTGVTIPEKNRILRYDGRPFTSDELKEEIKRRLK